MKKTNLCEVVENAVISGTPLTREMEAHVEQCGTCSAFRSFYAKIMTAAPLEVPGSLSENILSEARARTDSKRRFRLIVKFALSAAASVIVCAGILVMTFGESSGHPVKTKKDLSAWNQDYDESLLNLSCEVGYVNTVSQSIDI